MTAAISPARGPRSLFERSRLQSRIARRAWGVALGITVFALLAMYTSVVSNSSLTDALRGYPSALRQLFSLSDFTTGPGYFRAEIYSLTVPLLLIIPAVLWGSATIADEEEDGTIDLLATSPLGRRRILLEKWLAVVVDVAQLGAVLAASTLIGSSLFGVDVGVVELLAAAVAVTLLAITFATLSFTAAACLGRTNAARGTAAAGAVLAYLVSSLATLVHWLEGFRTASPWYHALGIDPIAHGFAIGHLAVLVATWGLMLCVADSRYRRRDLGI